MADETQFQNGFTRLSPVSCNPDLRRFSTNYDSQPMFRRQSTSEGRWENEGSRSNVNANLSDSITRGHPNNR